jgi:hypothetical protein
MDAISRRVAESIYGQLPITATTPVLGTYTDTMAITYLIAFSSGDSILRIIGAALRGADRKTGLDSSSPRATLMVGIPGPAALCYSLPTFQGSCPR